MKKYILFFISALTAITVKAQNGYNYQEWGVGAEGSYIRGYTNVQKQDAHPAFAISALYNYNPYVPIVLEFQMGTLSGGDKLPVHPPPTTDKYGRGYVNNYKAVILHGDIQMGAAIDYENSWILQILKNAYVGGGIGLISNSNTVQRYSVYAPPYPQDGYYKFPGNDKSTEALICLRLGYEFKIFDAYDEPSFAIDIGYTHNLVFGEGLDGYDDPPSKFKNNAVDQYRQISLGVKYFFGNVVSFNKLIRQFR